MGNGNGNREWLFGVENGKTTSNWRLNIFLAQLWETIILKQRWEEKEQEEERGKRQEKSAFAFTFFYLNCKLEMAT